MVLVRIPHWRNPDLTSFLTVFCMKWIMPLLDFTLDLGISECLKFWKNTQHQFSWPSSMLPSFQFCSSTGDLPSFLRPWQPGSHTKATFPGADESLAASGRSGVATGGRCLEQWEQWGQWMMIWGLPYDSGNHHIGILRNEIR